MPSFSDDFSDVLDLTRYAEITAAVSAATGLAQSALVGRRFFYNSDSGKVWLMQNGGYVLATVIRSAWVPPGIAGRGYTAVTISGNNLVFSANEAPLTETVALPDALGTIPDWALPETIFGAVNETTAEHVISSRALPLANAGGLTANDIVEFHAQVFIPDGSIYGVKSLRLCVDADAGGSLLQAFEASEVGSVDIYGRLLVGTLGPHQMRTSVQFNDELWAHKRGSVGVNFATTPAALQLRGWVADARDFIQIDSLSFRYFKGVPPT